MFEFEQDIKDFKVFSIWGFPLLATKNAQEEEELKAMYKVKQFKNFTLIKEPEISKLEEYWDDKTRDFGNILDNKDKRFRNTRALIALPTVLILTGMMLFKHLVYRIMIKKQMGEPEIREFNNWTVSMVEHRRNKIIKKLAGIE